MSPDALPAIRAVLACRALFRAADLCRSNPSDPAKAREALQAAEIHARAALDALPRDDALEGLAAHLALSGHVPAFLDPGGLNPSPVAPRP